VLLLAGITERVDIPDPVFEKHVWMELRPMAEPTVSQT
jgi:hypothetical protein